jgi:dsRNA-specific ribonuclease
MIAYTEFTSGNFSDFREEMIGTLRYRCLLKQTTVTKYFDNYEGMNLLRKAFIHKSYDKNYNYEFLELLGDREVNLSVVEYLLENRPDIKILGIIDKTKSNLISSSSLSKLTRKFGYDRFSIYGEEIQELMTSERYKDDIENCEKCMKMYEDNMEALIGSISTILSKGTGNYGVAHQACHNFVYNLLDQIDIPTTYEKIVDPVTQLNEIFNKKGWGKGLKNNPCNFKNCLAVYDIKDDTKTDPLNYYKKEIRQYGWDTDQNIVNAIKQGYGHISYSYACPTGTKKLLAVETDKTLMGAKQKAAAIALQKLAKIGIRYDAFRKEFY